MNATKILWGQVLLVAFVVAAFVWGATEWVAWRLAFQSQLGRPWFEVFGWPLYQPPAFFWWWFAYDAYARGIFVEGAYIAASGGIAAVVVAIALSVWRAREVKRVTTYGSARWAETREVREAGLTGHDGALLGRWRDHYLRHDGPEHVLCFAPARSGKGVGLVVPTLLTWPGSAIVHDIKGENWTLTAGWRARFGRVLLFDPTNAASAAYNPLLEVRRGEWEVRDVQNIADVLVDPEGALERRSHWEKTSHSLLVGAILHVLYAELDKTLAGVANFLSDPRRPIETTPRTMMTTPHRGKGGVHPVIAGSARELLNKSDNERSGVLSTAMSFLGLYRDPVVAAVTRRCDWRIRDLVEAAAPATLYLVVPPSDISRAKARIAAKTYAPASHLGYQRQITEGETKVASLKERLTGLTASRSSIEAVLKDPVGELAKAECTLGPSATRAAGIYSSASTATTNTRSRDCGTNNEASITSAPAR